MIHTFHLAPDVSISVASEHLFSLLRQVEEAWNQEKLITGCGSVPNREAIMSVYKKHGIVQAVKVYREITGAEVSEALPKIRSWVGGFE
jgi:hypothetical protein